ncbi:hypothetical protein EMIT0P171_30328 [Pseudomonas sp. IT-P171]
MQGAESGRSGRSAGSKSRDTGLKVYDGSNVGASLLAMAVDQSTSMLNVMPSSRAGSLPQGEYHCFRDY